MPILLEILFWTSVAGIFHSYVLFPLTIRLINLFKHSDPVSENPDFKPLVSILISVYNEESVIIDKLSSILKGNYPIDKVEIVIGSDASDDKTNELVEEFLLNHGVNILFYPYNKRRGKPNVINELVNHASGEILILTDANVLFDENTINELAKPFQLKHIGLVDSQMINMGMKKQGISFQEKAYISREVKIKHIESKLWGTMMGPFGGCYAIRKNLYKPVPENFLVDDFYINMLVLEAGYKAISNPKSMVYEDVSNDLAIEYKRKVRIATGNFQNLSRFSTMIWPPWSSIGYSFLSHKVLRWLGPHFMLTALISLGILSFGSVFFRYLLAGYITLLILPIVDFGLKRLNLHIPILRFLTHFIVMNLAMGVGFIRYLKGVRSNVWQPTKRHQ